MKYSTVTFTIPESFRPRAFLSPTLSTYGMQANFVMHTLVGRLRYAFEPDRGAAISQRILRECGGYRSLHVFKELLQRREICRKGKAKQTRYWPADHFQPDRLMRTPCTDRKFAIKLNGKWSELRARKQNEQLRRRRPVHTQWEAWQRRLSVDVAEMERILAEIPAASNPYGIQRATLEDIQAGRWRFVIDAYGRVHNNISNLKTDLRGSLRLNGQRLWGVDISNSQPAFLGLLMLAKPPLVGGFVLSPIWIEVCDNQPVGRKEDNKYVGVVSSGQLYELLQAESGLDRATTKRALLRDVFARRGRYPSPTRDAFGYYFPDLLRWIDRFNKHDHGALVRHLQRVESEFMIHLVGRRLALHADSCSFISLHDGIYTTQECLACAEAAIQSAAAEIGFRYQAKSAAT